MAWTEKEIRERIERMGTGQVIPPAPKITATPETPEEDDTELEREFDHWWSVLCPHLPPFAKQVPVAPGRKFAFDRASVHHRLAIELEGYDHQLPERYHSDIEKYNLAVEHGWRLLRCTTRMLRDNPHGFIWQVVRCLGVQPSEVLERIP